ncbi:MAG: Coenzyme F420 hydrogenase/dehydrogenase, beta subunit C-terminal domain [Candidatus Omnitrophota bacterium]|jgi:coenzyme F420-reducing hydrogenase beta subunit
MKFNRQGELNPVIYDCRQCGLCLSVCPHINELETDIFATYLGEYLECYSGYSKIGKEREHASSGGLATRMLKVLLEEKIVSKVVAIGRSSHADKIFEPVIVSTTEELGNLASSKYYPVEFSSVVKHLKKNDETIAIIGLPCVIRGLRIIKEKYPEIGDKIKYLFGLTCAHNNNKNYTNFLLRKSGARTDKLLEICYRCKKETKNAMDYYFQTTQNDGSSSEKIFNSGFIRNLWAKGFFSLSACLKCKDLVSEQADISFMDAWIDPYIKDPKGTSLVIVRNEKMKELLENEAKKGNIFLEPIKEAIVFKAQLDGFILKKMLSGRKRLKMINNKISCIYSDNYFIDKLSIFIFRVIMLFENIILSKSIAKLISKRWFAIRKK